MVWVLENKALLAAGAGWAAGGPAGVCPAARWPWDTWGQGDKGTRHWQRPPRSVMFPCAGFSLSCLSLPATTGHVLLISF